MATLVELKARAKKMGYKGYSKLKKGDLEKLLTTPPPKPPRTKPVSQRVPVKQVQKEETKDPTFLPTDLTAEERGKRLREMTADESRAYRKRQMGEKLMAEDGFEEMGKLRKKVKFATEKVYFKSGKRKGELKGVVYTKQGKLDKEKWERDTQEKVAREQEKKRANYKPKPKMPNDWMKRYRNRFGITTYTLRYDKIDKAEDEKAKKQ